MPVRKIGLRSSTINHFYSLSRAFFRAYSATFAIGKVYLKRESGRYNPIGAIQPT